MEERMTEEINESADIENSIIEPLESEESDIEDSELDEETELISPDQAEAADSDDEVLETPYGDQTPDQEQTESPQENMDSRLRGNDNDSDENTLTLESVVEAVLFSSDEPLTTTRLANIVEATTKQVREYIDNLNKKYEENNNAFRIEQIAGGYQMLTLSRYNHWLKQLLRVRSESKLSPAALETLAIIAYKQPVIRADIEAIRGVAVGEVIRSLSYKGLVKIVGRAEVLGRPMLYGTTKKFLEVFGLNTLKDLPKIEELKKPPN